ncbi:hypothetical protein OOZ19_23705 [Saccharopolyspora sp. NFXS83]|uniref:hypothetical protein n=1 Tax=Saccharopolyspora sp. NFXS83 TaxID=2993560 RepID=UPI00224A78AA|nr:hypothetical protein [Saccharopolyspora sp. NFXS83]MCX2733259.1 hypothetical protein [Saccharopolyspora sp. NFXS83]
MTEVVTDERVAVVLRPFVRASTPLLDVLRQSDPFRLRGRFEDTAADAEAEGAAPADEVVAGEQQPQRNSPHDADDADRVVARRPSASASPAIPAAPAPSASSARSASSVEDEPDEGPGLLHKMLRQLDGMRLPGSSTWDAMGVDERCDWWAQRVGRLVAVVAGLPRFGGVLTSRLPIRNALGLAGQGLVLSAIAAEHGVTDHPTRVRLIAKVLLDRDLAEGVASGARGGAQAEEDAKTAELTEELDAAERSGGSRLKAVVRTVWRMARALWEIDSELDKRPQGRFYHEWLGNVPIVGVVGGYLGERSALRRIGKLGAKWLRAEGYAVTRR